MPIAPRNRQYKNLHSTLRTQSAVAPNWLDGPICEVASIQAIDKSSTFIRHIVINTSRMKIML